jgi:MFS family permease
VSGRAEAGDNLAFGTSRARWVIAATVLGSGIAALDATVVGIALPTIGRSFHSGVGTLQWVVSGYSLTLAAFLLLGGSLGDRLGRKRMFCTGVVWFALASMCCGIAPNAGVLIGARVLQGVGGALLVPASLAILQASFLPDDRSRAIGAWSGLGGIATAAGPLLGGYLITAASWRWVFFINVPLAIGVLLIAIRHVPESRDPSSAGHVDFVGAGLAVLFLAGLTYGLIEGPAHGWTGPVVLASLIVAVFAAPLFLLAEHAAANPMLPLGVFRTRQFSGANAVTFIVYGALGGALFLLPLELQLVSHYSPLDSGLALLPVTLIMLTFSARSGQLAARIGPRLQMTAGPVVVGAGAAGDPDLRSRSRHHRGPAHLYRHGGRSGRARRSGLCGQQRGGTGGRSFGRSGAPVAGGHHGSGRTRAAPLRRRIPHCRDHRRAHLCRRRTSGGTDHSQPRGRPPSAPPPYAPVLLRGRWRAAATIRRHPRWENRAWWAGLPVATPRTRRPDR